MRILHVANFYGPESGGIKTTLHELGRGYLAQGHEFIYIVPGTRYSWEQTEFGRKITLPSVKLIGAGSYRIIRSNRELKAYIKYFKPDRIEVSDRFTLMSIGRWAKRNGVPSVVFSHETLKGLASRFLPKFLPIGALVNWHNRRLAASFDNVVCTTDFALQEFLEIDIPNTIKVPLGVDLDLFNPFRRSQERRAYLAQGADLLLVHCGRLSPEKEPQRSIEALSALLDKGVSAHLVIIGTGPLHARLIELSRDLPVTMLGYLGNRSEVAAIIASSDISIAPGPLETFCLSALEALASGTPVIASSSSAVGEFLIDDHGFHVGEVAGDDGESFADAIISLKSHEHIRIHARGKAETLPWSRTIEKMIALHHMPARVEFYSEDDEVFAAA